MVSGLTRFLMAVLSGALLALAFPNFITPQFSLWPSYLAWFALVPLLLSLEKGRSGQAFFLGWECGLSFFSCTLYWITWIKELDIYAGPGLLALSAFLGIYIGLWTMVFVFIENKSQGLAILTAPFLWAALEFLRGHLFTGFAWNTLAASQYSQLTLLQMLDVTGQGGLSALLVFCNVALYHLWWDFRYHHRGWGVPLVLAALFLVAGAAGYGTYRLAQPLTGK